MINGVKFAGAFLAFLSALIKITSKGGETVKLAGTLLAVSVAIGLLAGISVLLGLVDTEQLAKGVIAVAVLGIIMTRMIKATQGANDVKGNVIAMAVAIGVMAAVVAALSLIDSIKLAIATACLGALMGMFALMELAGSKASGSIISLIAITAVIVVLAGVLYLLRDLPVKNSLAVAASLSILLLAMSVTLGLLSIVGAAALPGLVSLAVVTAVVAALAFILYQLKDLDPDQALGMVKALSIFLLALSGCCVVLAVVGTVAVPALIGVAVLSALILALIGLTALAAHISKTLPDLGKNLGDFMKNTKPFIEGAKNIDESVGKGISSLCGAILKLTGTEIISAVTAFLSGDASFSKFGSQLQAFGKAIVAYANTVKGINAEDILASAKAAKALVALNDALPKSGGLFGMITGNKDLSKLAGQLKSFGTGLNDYSKTLTDVNPEKVSGASEAVKSLVEAVNATDSARANGVGTFVQAIDTLAETNVKGFMNAFKDSSSDVRNVGSTLTSSLAKGMKSKTSAVTSSAAKVVDSMETAMSSKEKEFQRIGVVLISAFALGIQAQTTQAVNAATYLGTASAYGVSQAYTNFYMNGINLGSGLVIGMNAMQNSVYNAGYALGQAAVRGEKAGQKSHSPSKLTIQAGKWLGEGLIIGINAMESKTYDAGQNMGETAFTSIRKALSGMNDLVDSDMDTSPTIRPVLDLTNVKAGAGQMNDLFSDPSFTPLATLRAIGNLSNRNRQNGNSEEVVRAIGKLEKSLKSVGNTYNSINGITYDNDSEISEAVETLVRAATVGRRR